MRAVLALLAPTRRPTGRTAAPSPEDARLAHEVSVLADLGQRLAQAEARGDTRGAARLAGLVAARRDRVAEAQLVAMPEGLSEEVLRAMEAVTRDLARGRLPLVEMGVG